MCRSSSAKLSFDLLKISSPLSAYLKLSLLEHFVEVVDSSGGLLGESLDTLQEFWVLCVDKVGEITAVVKDHVEGLAVGEENCLLDTPKEKSSGF